MRSRILALGSVAGLVLVSMGFGAAAPAGAVTDPNGLAAAQALNVPGTVLTGAAAGGVTTYTEGELAGLLASKMKYNWSWTKDAMLSKFSGNTTISPPPTSGLTPAQVATLDQTAAQFRVPATTLGTVTKVVGGVSIALVVARAGVALGVSIDQTLGFDPTGGLCAGSSTDPVLAAITGIAGTNCAQWQLSKGMMLAANSDVSVTPYGGVACAAAGSCFSASWQKITFTDTRFSYSATGNYACFTLSGSPMLSGTDGNGATFYYQDSGGAAIPGFADSNGVIHTSAVYPNQPGYTYDGGDTTAKNPLVGHCSPDLTSYFYQSSHTTGSGGPMQPDAPLLVPAEYGWAVYNSSTGTYSWQSGTTPAPVTVPNANPTRQFKCVIAFQSGGSATAYTANFTEGGATAVPAPVCPAVPPSEIPTTTTIYETSPGGDIQLFQQPTTPEYQNWKSTYPECANGSCLLDLRKSAVSCFQNAAACDGWMTDPNRDTLYACWYGTHSVPLSQCYVYAPTFTPAKVAAGMPYADPSTGTSTGVQTAPVEGGVMDNPVNAPSSTPRQCWPTGWGQLNPLAWVLQPLQCGLTWAFVPSQPQVDAQLAKVQTAWKATPMFQMAGVVTGWHFQIAMTGCKGPGVPIVYGTKTYDTWYPLNACDQPMAFWAGVCSTAVNLAFIILGGLAITRHIGGIVQYGGLGGRES